MFEVLELGEVFSFSRGLGACVVCGGTCMFGWSVKFVMLVCLSFLLSGLDFVSAFCFVLFTNLRSFLGYVVIDGPVGWSRSRGVLWFI